MISLLLHSASGSANVVESVIYLINHAQRRVNDKKREGGDLFCATHSWGFFFFFAQGLTSKRIVEGLIPISSLALLLLSRQSFGNKKDNRRRDLNLSCRILKNVFFCFVYNHPRKRRTLTLVS